MKYYLGIDQSSTNTGIAVINENDEIILSTSIPTSKDFLKFFSNYSAHFLQHFQNSKAFKSGLVDSECKLTKKKKDLTAEEKEMLVVSNELRYNYIAEEVDRLLKLWNVEGVGIETISFGSAGSTADLGRLLGYIERTIYLNGVSLYRYEPKSVKKFAGKGNYSKEEMYEALSEYEKTYLMEFCPINTRGTFVGLDDRVDALWISKMVKRDSLNN